MNSKCRALGSVDGFGHQVEEDEDRNSEQEIEESHRGRSFD